MQLEGRRNIYRRWHEAADAAGLAPKAFLLQRLGTARYRLGTSDADLVIPYTVDESVRRAFALALDELANTYVSHNRDVLGDEIYDAVVLGSSGVGAAPPVRAGGRQDCRVPPAAFSAAGTRSTALLPALAPPILERWWGEDGGGRRLVDLWARWMRSAVAEGCETGEDTPLLLHLMILSLFGETRRLVEGFGLPRPVGRELGACLLLGLHLSLEIALEAAGTATGALLTAQVLSGPRACFYAWPDAAAACRTAWLLPQDGESLRRQLGAPTALAGPLDWRALVDGFYRKRSGRRRLLQAAARARLADLLGQALAASPPGKARAVLYGLACDIRAVEAACEARRTRKALIQRLRGLCDPGLPEHGRRAVERLVDAVEHHRPARPDLKALGGRETVVERVALALSVDDGDHGVAEALRTLLPALQRRSGKETDRDLDFEYRRGRLYRLSAKGGPLLAARRPAPAARVAHLFSDMKDFTLRTSKLKEEAMADFVRRNFYEPILGLARRHYAGLKGLDDRGGVHLNNLLGDAISVSGDVVALLTLARDIRRHLTGYRKALRERLAAMGDDALAAAELSAGTFISYGPVPTVLRFEDPVWGELSVSIAEGINESARGTGRSPAVRRLLETRLDALRRQTNQPGLQLPFRVYVAGSVGLPLDPEEEVGIQDALAAGDQPRALAYYQAAAERFVTRQGGSSDGGATGSGRTAIYNAGEALSREALAAYVEAVGPDRFQWGSVPASNLDPTLRRRFAFLEPELRVVVRWDVGGAVAEIFRFAGSVTFKGFEAAGATEVWELVDPETPIHRGLALDPAVRGSLRPLREPAASGAP